MKRLADVLSVQCEVLFRGESPYVCRIVIELIKVNVMAVIPIRFCIDTGPPVIPICQHMSKKPSFGTRIPDHLITIYGDPGLVFV
jgi:hypothetical protein